MSWLKSLSSIITTLSGLAVAVGAGMEAAGIRGGTELAAGATAFGLAMAKDGHKEK